VQLMLIPNLKNTRMLTFYKKSENGDEIQEIRSSFAIEIST